MLYYYRLSGYLSQVYNNNNRQSWEAQGKEAQQGWSILHGCRRFVVVVVVGGGTFLGRVSMVNCNRTCVLTLLLVNNAPNQHGRRHIPLHLREELICIRYTAGQLHER